MRRRYKRISMKGIHVRVETVSETKAELSDLSNEGIGLKSPMRLTPGCPCMVSIGTNGSLMILRGTTVWERFAGWSMGPRGQAGPLFSAGIRLDEPHNNIMSTACVAGNGRTRPVRIYAPDMKILLSFTESLTVLNISYGGLLAESWNPLEPGTENDTRLFLPDRPEPFKCLMRVTSCQSVKHDGDRKYHIGFEFVDLDREQAERIRAFIRVRSAV
ncbi:MAG: PilZ domain-containing protein [Nitrospirae bacterium]|nr:PilZ domain-containing protein [Nitrospirota bacterium]